MTTADWNVLARRVSTCTRCPELARNRTQVVVGQAPPGARLVVLGEAPGAAEDASGLPFVGKAGRVLDAALAAAGLPRSTVAVLNTLKCRPPGNRRPAPLELAACRPWAELQLDLIAPRLVVTLGTTATAWALGRRTVRLGDVRGTVTTTASGLAVLPTYHPSGALRWGPNGEPMRLLHADLALAASLVAEAA
ncbi:MAG: phage polymerase-related protein [Mycobacterium sp.]|nr:phage polymerase-related protein [Mycobacterium sp.]